MHDATPTVRQTTERKDERMKNLVTGERAQFLDDIIITAMEGGINYWAQRLRYNPDSPVKAIIRDVDDYDSGQWTITRAIVRNGIRGIVESENILRDGPLRDTILLANLKNDAGYIDAIGADVIVQAGLFGKVVYG